jgi:hypothetical protein
MKLNNSIPYHPARKKTKKAGVPECHLSIPLKNKKKKCNLVLEISTSFTKILHYLKDKNIWMELLNKKTQTDRPILEFFCCHMVSFMLKK